MALRLQLFYQFGLLCGRRAARKEGDGERAGDADGFGGRVAGEDRKLQRACAERGERCWDGCSNRVGYVDGSDVEVVDGNVDGDRGGGGGKCGRCRDGYAGAGEEELVAGKEIVRFRFPEANIAGHALAWDFGAGENSALRVEMTSRGEFLVVMLEDGLADGMEGCTRLFTGTDEKAEFGEVCSPEGRERFTAHYMCSSGEGAGFVEDDAGD